jgi:hypothetical protein
MKNLKDYIVNENNFFKNLGIGQEAQIRKWLDEHKIKNYTINPDLTIDVKGDLFIEEDLPDFINFNRVLADCVVWHTNVTTLRGVPKYVSGNFECLRTSIETLEYCPIEIGGSFDVIYNKKLKNIDNLPQKVGYITKFYSNSKRVNNNTYQKLCDITVEKVFIKEKDYHSWLYSCNRW